MIKVTNMKIRCISTGSTGNCYVLTDHKGDKLILDCGVPIMAIKKACAFDVEGIVGAVCTHRHTDHSLSVDRIRNIGIPVIAPYKDRKTGTTILGDYLVKWFDLTTLDGQWTHTDTDGEPCPCYGFWIHHEEMGTLVYVTDTELCKWRFNNINHILVSCNYQKEHVVMDDPKTQHVLRGHMELGTVRDFVKANATTSLVNVMLCHMSAENAVASECVDEVQKSALGAHVVAMKPNMVIDLKKTRCPF